MTPRKTSPTRQYDIFFVAGQGTELPSGCIPMTEYDPKENGRWAMLATGRDGWAKPGSNLGTNAVPSWNEMSG